MVPIDDLKCTFKETEKIPANDKKSKTYSGKLWGQNVAIKCIPEKTKEESEKILDLQQYNWRECNNPYICLYLGEIFFYLKNKINFEIEN